MASIGDGVMSREACVCMQSVRVDDRQRNWIWISIHPAKYTHWNSTHTFRNILNGEKKKDSGILLSPLTELKQQTEQAAYDTLIYFMLEKRGKWVRSHKAARGKSKQRENQSCCVVVISLCFKEGKAHKKLQYGTMSLWLHNM